MIEVLFRCNRKNETMFVLHSHKEMDCVPMIGDVIKTNNEDFQKASFRVKPWSKEKGVLKDVVYLDFKVISRTYCTHFNKWELICEPTAEALIFLLKNIKLTKK